MSDYEKIKLQLGDIIEIDSPLNSNYHEKICYINYIDKTKIKLICEDNEFILLINEEGNFLEESIENINLLYRNDTSSYIKQNNLNIDQRISIYFNEPAPFIINGKITNIEEDMIEVTIDKTDEVIYIDFAYSGIPEHLNIEKIIVKNRTESEDSDNNKKDTEENEDSNEENENEYTESSNLFKQQDDDFDIMNIDEGKKLIFDELIFDEELEEIYYNVNVSDSEKRYSLEEQAHDFLNYNIGLLDEKDKTQENYDKINKEINRFIELRETYSDYDKNKNVKLPTLNSEFNKPLKESILNLTNKINWLLPVISNKKILLENSDELLYDDEDNEFILKEKNMNFIKKLKVVTENWIKNNSREKLNNYKNYINELYELFTSKTISETVNSENLLNLHAPNIEAITDNNDDFNSYCIEKNNLTKKRFSTDVFNEALNIQEIEYINGKKTLKKTKLTNDDKINITSFLTLPLPIIEYSKINSNYTDLIHKINLNNSNLYYYQFLKQNTSINEYILTDNIGNNFNDNDENIHNNNIFKKICSFKYEKTNADDGTYMDNLNKLLDSFLPSNNAFIENILEYKEIYNLSELLNLLQCANIDYYNIHVNNYSLIIKELEKNSDKYKIDFIKNNKQIDELIKEINKNIKTNNITYSFKLLNKELKAAIFENYKIDETIFLNDEELLNKIISIDDGNFLTSCLNKSIIDLTVSNLLDTFIKQQDKLSKQEKINETSEENNTCEKYTLSKKYNSIQELESDNNKHIYFDPIYDKTVYSIINEYKEEKNTMDHVTFKNFLIDELKEKMNLTNENAVREAKSIIEEKREIIEGDYALLINKEDNKNYIYIRKNDEWIIDEQFKDNFYIDSNKIFCDINKKCLSKDNKCQSNDKILNKLDKNNIDEILRSFDLKYNITIEEIKGKVNSIYEKNKNLLKKRHLINTLNNERINEKLLKFNKVDIESTFTAPNEKLRDEILAYPDLIKRNYYIRIFAINFLRYSNSDEDKNWLYCRKTDKKILPLFLLRLANVFDNKEQYLLELDSICAEQGTISDDNSFWVDKYSGYIIKRIEFSNDEGFDEAGFKLNTKEVLQGDYTFNSTNNALSKETMLIYGIIKTMGQMIGINLGNFNENISNNVYKLLKKNISDKKTYDEKIERLLKKDSRAKNLPNYEDAYNNLLLMYTISYICIFIQTSIPSFKTKKTFPGCIRSFNGFPLNSSDDKTFIIYISCIVNKIKSSIKPWNTIQKTSETNIAKKLESIIKDNILNDPFFQDLINKKLEYLLTNKSEDIPDEIALNNWFTFMPNLNDIKIKEENLVPIDGNFTGNMLDNFKKGGKENIIDLINSKIIFFSNKIISSIQNIVKKKTPILQTSNGEPYMENSCCNTLNNTILYFIEEDKSIYDNNLLLQNYLNVIKDITFMEKSTLLYHAQNSKLKIPKISNDFNENTIYKAFIYYCNFNNNLPIDNDLKAICNSKPININYDNKISEIVENIKAQGKNYSKDTFFELLNVINKKNSIISNYNNSALNNIENIRNIIDDYNKNKLIEHYDEMLMDKLYNLVDTYDIVKFKNDDTNDIKNYLYKVNKLIHSQILSKIKTFDFVTKKEYNMFENDLVFDFDVTNIYLFKNYLIDFIDVFPNIIINKSVNINKIPKHWKLSEIHNNDIKNIVKKYYEMYLNFDDNISLKNVFDYIKNKYKIFTDLSHYLMYYEEILQNNDKIISSIFDKDLLNFIYNNFFLTLFNELLTILDNNDFELSLIANDEDYDKNKLFKQIYNYLTNFLITINSHYNLIKFDYKKVKDNILFAKEKEKDLITDFLKNLSDEERNIENIFKNNKLEKWNKGMQKGITQYVKENYDEEREAMEKQALLEKKINKQDVVTDMNKEIYMMNLEEEEFNQQNIEDEEYNMSNIPDNDDADSDYEY